jgi:hypothetical protein
MLIVIPKKQNPFRAIIKKGSGIVMILHRNDMATIYYEGNLYGAENLTRYEDRIKQAAMRAATHYPTMAMSGVLEENIKDFTMVGICDTKNDYSVTFFDEAARIIEEWLS